jgi:hypothetical protein
VSLSAGIDVIACRAVIELVLGGNHRQALVMPTRGLPHFAVRLPKSVHAELRAVARLYGHASAASFARETLLAALKERKGGRRADPP